MSAAICAAAVRARSVAGGFALSPCGQADVAFWREYFDLDSDYGALLAPVLDAPLAAAKAACPGLRLLRQDFFETLCAFISSAHNAMPRIRRILRGLASLGREGAFPTPRQVAQAGVEGLRALGLGYRAAICMPAPAWWPTGWMPAPLALWTMRRRCA